MFRVVRWADAQPTYLGRDDCPAQQVFPMMIQDMGADRALLAGRNVYQPDDTRMRETADNGQFAKVFIQCHKDSLLPMRLRQDLLVARIFHQVTRPEDIVASGLQCCPGATPDTSIQKKPHAADSM